MWSRRGAAAAAVAVACTGAVLLVARPAAPQISVDAGTPLQPILRGAPAGATVTLGPGAHRGPVTIERAVTLRGQPGARLVASTDADAALAVAASGARVEALFVRGGVSGIGVREANDVELDGVTVTGAQLQGIEVVDASAHITGARVENLQSSYAQGIEVRNSDGRPDTVVEHSSVRGGQEGIVSHVSEVTFRDNEVTETTMRGVVVTEMSDGIVEDNRVSDSAGVGLYCGDMSRCAFSGNQVATVAAGRGGRSSEGWGLVVNFHATASSDGDILAGEAGDRAAFLGSRFLNESPLEPGAGSAALVPAALATAVALAAVALTFALSAAALCRTRSSSRPATRAVAQREVNAAGGRAWRGVWVALWLGIGVQGFHMAEHVLQVYRVHVDGVPGRGGLAGPSVDAEVVHFLYNAAVLTMLVVVAFARRRGWTPAGSVRIGDRLMAAAVAIQGFHMVEHSTKLVQHLATGAKVNPGILGNAVDLVWLHYAINLSVYVAFVGACAAYGWGWRERARRWLDTRSRPPVRLPSRAGG